MMSKEFNEGHEIGISHGFDAANFSDAYGDPIGDPTDRLDGRSDDYRSGFTTGWAEGVERFENDQFVDGSER